MSSYNKQVALSVSLAFVAIGMASAHAATTGSVALTSDYLFRGISQTDQDPALQGGIEILFDSRAAGSGFYIGAWGSNINWLSDLSSDVAPISSSLEFDAYGGYRGKFSDSVGFDVGALYYYYPGEFPDDANSANTGEVYAGISAGVFSAKYFYALTDLFGYVDSDGSGYLDLALNWTFTPGWTLNAHGGKQWIESSEAYEYTDWELGVTKAFDSGFSITAAYNDTDADAALYTNPHGHYLGDSTVTLTFAKAF